MKYLILLSLLAFSTVTFAQSQFRYEGYIENGGTPVTAAAQRFTVTLRKPGCASTLGLTTWDSGATIAITNGEFNLVPSFNEALLSVAMDPNQIFGCTAGSARDLEITWVDQARTFVVALQDAPRSSFSNLAGNSNTLSSRTQDQFLKIDSYVGQTPLSNSQVNSLITLVNGTSSLYSNSTTAAGGDAAGTLGALTVTGLRGRTIGAAVPAAGQVLKYDGTSWMPSADDAGVAPGDASYAASGVVRFDTSAAVSGILVNTGIARLANSGVTIGTYGNNSTVPSITVDIFGRLTNVVNTPIGIDAAQVTAGTLPVARGGTGLNTFVSNSLVMANATGTALTSATCAIGEILKWSGTAWACVEDEDGSDSAYPAGAPVYGLTTNSFKAALWPQSFASPKGVGMSGLLFRPDDTPVVSATTQFRIQIRTPGTENCLLWEEFQTKDLTSSGGSFKFSLDDSSEPSLVVNTLPYDLQRVFSNRLNFSALTGCSIGTSYNPTSTDPRVLQVAFRQLAIDPWEILPPARIASGSVNSLQLGGYRADEFLKIEPYANQTPLTNTGVNTLLSLIGGSSTLYARPTDPLTNDLSGTFTNPIVSGIRGRPVVAAAATPAAGQILKYDGANWNLAADDTGGAPGNASYAASGLVRFDTSAAVSGINIAGGVARLSDSGVTAGTFGSASQVPILTIDSFGRTTVATTVPLDDATKLPLAGGTMTGALDMGTSSITSLGNINLGGTTSAINMTGVTANINLTGISSYISAPQLRSRDLRLGNATASQWASLKVPDSLGVTYELVFPSTAPVNGHLLSTNAAGQMSWVAPPSDPNAFVNGGNAFGTLGVIGTNDNFDLRIETNNTPRMTITNGGGVGVGTTTPATLLDIAGEIKIGSTATGCISGTAGALRFNAGDVQYCNGSVWQSFGIAGAGGDITSVNAGIGLVNGGVSGDVTLDVNTGLLANRIPQVGGTALGANGVVVANGTASALTSLNCALNQVIKFDASGFATCAADALGGPPFSVGGTANIFLGQNSGGTTPSGTTNVGVGVETLFDIVAGSDNTAVGYQSGRTIASGVRNTLVGSISGIGLTDGSGNTFIGTNAGSSVTTGNNNTFIGTDSGQFFNSGNNNIILGSNNGNDIVGQSNRILISDGSGNIRMSADGAGQIGFGTTNPIGAIHLSRDTQNTFLMDSYFNTGSTDSSLLIRRARGTRAAPSAVLGGDILGGWGVVGFDSVALDSQTSAGVYAVAAENFSSLNNGTQLSFYTTNLAANVKQERVRISANGNVGIGTTTPAATLDVNGSFRLGTNSASLNKVVRCNPSLTIPDTAIPAGASTTYPLVASSCPGVTTGMVMNCNFVSITGVNAPFSFLYAVVDATDETNNRIRIRVTNPTTSNQPSGGAMTVSFACIGMN